MGSMEEKMKTGGLVSGSPSLLEEMKILKEMQDQNGARKNIHSELWHACAGPLTSLPQVGSLVYYFPQGHSEQVAVSTKRSATSQIPNYPNLPPQLLCQVHNVALHADKDTDEIFSQMSLQPIKSEKDVLSIPGFGPKTSKQPNNQTNSSAKHLLQVTQVLMVVSQCPVVQQKSFFIHWISQCNLRLMSLSFEICMIIHGHFVIYTAGSRNDTFSLPIGAYLLAQSEFEQGILFSSSEMRSLS